MLDHSKRNKERSKKKTLMLALATLMLLSCTSVFLVSANTIDEGYAAASEYGTPTVIEIAPGMNYSYKPTFTAGLDVTVTIEEDSENWATISSLPGESGGMEIITLNVNIPSSANPGTTYDVVLKATTSNPYQELFIPITFDIKGNATVSGSHPNIVVGSEVNMTPSVSGVGVFKWSVTSGKTLPTGLSYDKDTGKVTGTVTEIGTCTIYLTATSEHSETADLVVTFEVVPSLTVTNSPTAGVIIYVIS